MERSDWSLSDEAMRGRKFLAQVALDALPPSEPCGATGAKATIAARRPVIHNQVSSSYLVPTQGAG